MLYDKKWDEVKDNFKSAEELQVGHKEYEALKQVLRMLESGEIKDFQPSPKVLCMGVPMGKTACGTAGCIGGYVADTMGIASYHYVVAHNRPDSPLRNLYWSVVSNGVTVLQAAFALRSFLTTGKPNWAEALQLR